MDEEKYAEDQNEGPPADTDEESLLKQELLEFAEMDEFADLSEDDLLDIQEALEENKAEIESETEPFETIPEEIIEVPESFEEPVQEEPLDTLSSIDSDLESKMEQELAIKRRKDAASQLSRDDFIAYLGQKRTKIMYHALWYLVFNIDDNQGSKQMLYDQLKEVTSKDPVEPLAEHKFYFGLGFILRLKYDNQKIVRFSAGKLKIVGNIKVLKDILQIVGDPISERPILTKKEQNQMFQDFLKDDFEDI